MQVAAVWEPPVCVAPAAQIRTQPRKPPVRTRFRLVAAFAAAALALLPSMACHGERVGRAPPTSRTVRATAIDPARADTNRTAPAEVLGSAAHRDLVMTSRFCAGCHPAIYAEHEENTHGRAFIDEEARIATRDMAREDCVRCHTPRPIFQTGIGMTPMPRRHDLDEGNTCMTCHWKAGYDYATFSGGAQCTEAFDDRVGTISACASCHRIAGTPEQWSRAEHGKQAGRVCMDCHMPLVRRPVAVGAAPRDVRSHLFPAADNVDQIRSAYAWNARIVNDEVVVEISNVGAGHNFTTANAQRSVQSLVVVKDVEGRELYRSRMRFGHGVATQRLIEEHVLRMPSNSQIPSGASREHRVPLTVAQGTAQCRLYFKRYHPAEDTEPGISVLLEDRSLVFHDLTPSTASVDPEPESPPSGNAPPATTPAEAAGVDGLAKFAYPPPGTKTVDVPRGDTPEDIDRLIALFEYPVPYAKQAAVDRLVEIGAPAVPALIRALGSWDNEAFNRAMQVLERIGALAAPALLQALSSDQLYVRHHARRVLAAAGFPGDRPAIRTRLLAALEIDNAVDRASAAAALGALRDPSTADALRARLSDPDCDTVVAAAGSLAALGDADSVADIEAAMRRARFPESKRDLAVALATLGAPAGVSVLIDLLRHEDPVIRQSCFMALHDATGLYGGYDPRGTEFERRRALRMIQDRWARRGGAAMLRHREPWERGAVERAWHLVEQLAGGTDTAPGGDDDEIVRELAAMDGTATAALVRGLLGFPPGFAEKRARICRTLGERGDRDAAPYLAWALDDPVLSVEAWACWALERAGQDDAIQAVVDYQDRVRARAARGEVPASYGPAERLLVQAARTRLLLGDASVRDELVGFLLADDVGTRRIAIEGLEQAEGTRHGYDADAPLSERRAAYERWQ